MGLIDDWKRWAEENDKRPDGAESEPPLTGTPPLVGLGGFGILTGARGAVGSIAGMLLQNTAEQNDPTRFTSRPDPSDLLDFSAWRDSINSNNSGGGGEPDDGPIPTLDRIEAMITLLLTGLFGIVAVYVLGTLFEFQFVIDGD